MIDFNFSSLHNISFLKIRRSKWELLYLYSVQGTLKSYAWPLRCSFYSIVYIKQTNWKPKILVFAGQIMIFHCDVCWALVYFRGPWENILALWQYFKILLFQITNKTNLTLTYLINITSPSLTLPVNQRPPSAATWNF